MRRTMICLPSTLLALALTLGLAAETAHAGPFDDHRRGWLAGLEFGVGSVGIEYEQDGQTVESDETAAIGATLRLGYQFNRHFALTLDTRGVTRRDDGQEITVGSTVLMAKVHPGGGGFFIRAGAGRGCITTEFDADDEDAGPGAVREVADLDDEHALIVALGLGYEWMVSENFAVGLALDGRGAELDDQGDLTDIKFGEGTFGITMNWFF